MNKKILFAAPAVALGMAGLIGSGDSFATEGITDGAALRACLQEQTECKLGGDITLDATEHFHDSQWGPQYDYYWYTDLSVDIKNEHMVSLDLNGHNITANIPINIENGNLSIVNNTEKAGSINFTATRNDVRDREDRDANKATVKPQFRMVGSSDATKTLYSVLNLNSGVQVTSTENEAVRVSTGTTGYNRYYGTIVNLYGAEINAPKAVVVDDYNGRGQHSKKADNATKVNIGNKTTISTTDDALVSNVFAEWTIDDATIESAKNVISMNNGKVLVQSDNAKLSTEGKGAAVINVKESGSTNEASITIDKGVFQSTGENGVFYKDSNVNYQKTVGSIKINGGAFTASDLFSTGSHFNDAHKGFITGGTWGQRWDDRHDNDFVASGYLKDFDESIEGSKIMTVVEPTIEGLPEGYTIELSRRAIDDTELLESLLEKAGVKGTALNQYIEANLYDATKTPIHELPDGSEGITLKISGFNIPELQDGVSRKYHIIAMHETDDPENPEIYSIEANYNPETDEITLPNLTKFSYFGIAYEDTEIPTPAPASEPTTTPTTPETGAETAQTSGIVASTLALCMLTGATIAAFVGRKFFRKK